MAEFKIDYQNDTGPGDEGYFEWWEVTDGVKVFRVDTRREDAEWLMEVLNSTPFNSKDDDNGTSLMTISDAVPLEAGGGLLKIGLAHSSDWTIVLNGGSVRVCSEAYAKGWNERGKAERNARQVK